MKTRKLVIIMIILNFLNNCETIKSFRSNKENHWKSNLPKYNSFELVVSVEEEIHQANLNITRKLTEKEYTAYIQSHSAEQLKTIVKKGIQETNLFGDPKKSNLRIDAKILCSYKADFLNWTQYFIILAYFTYMGIFEETLEINLEITENGKLIYKDQSLEALKHHRGVIFPAIILGTKFSSSEARSASIKEQTNSMLEKFYEKYSEETPLNHKR